MLLRPPHRSDNHPIVGANPEGAHVPSRQHWEANQPVLLTPACSGDVLSMAMLRHGYTTVEEEDIILIKWSCILDNSSETHQAF